MTKHPKIYLGNSLLNINSQDETPFAARTDLKELESKAFVEKVGETKGAFFRAKTGLPK